NAGVTKYGFLTSPVRKVSGLYNRRGFRILAEQKMKEAARLKQEVVLFLVDIDDMKFINDNFGHKAGDQALVETAAILKKLFRKMDIICRWGGDEFIILAVNAEGDRLAVMRERLEDHLRNYNANSVQTFKLSLSMGAFSNADALNRPLDEMIQQADKAMYQEKFSGKK
ncbi:MAG: GGDEF domain-containing protein, partial [Legionellaceae bacterium]|nr:GGDEF domain-containing protein [Legionellaceae bacterium]